MLPCTRVKDKSYDTWVEGEFRRKALFSRISPIIIIVCVKVKSSQLKAHSRSLIVIGGLFQANFMYNALGLTLCQG